MQAKNEQKSTKRKQAKLLQFSRKRMCGIGIPDFRYSSTKDEGNTRR